MIRRRRRLTDLVGCLRGPAWLRGAPALGLAAAPAFVAARGFTPPRGLAEVGFFGRVATDAAGPEPLGVAQPPLSGPGRLSSPGRPCAPDRLGNPDRPGGSA